MGAIIELEVPPTGFVFGRLLHIEPGTKVHIEQIVPIGDATMPFLWVSDNLESFEGNLESPNDEIQHEVILTDEVNNRRLYRFDWEGDDELVRAVRKFDGAILDAKGNSEGWNFRIRFDKHEDISRFHEYCDEKGVPITVERVYSAIEISGTAQAGMTTTQARTLIDALEKGYFDIPRKTNLVELGDMYGISDQAVSERLRRATAKLIKNSLMPEMEASKLAADDD